MSESARSTTVLPGISDHQAVLCGMNLQYVRAANSGTRRICRYQKERVSGMSLALDSYCGVFETHAEFMNMEELGKIFNISQHICTIMCCGYVAQEKQALLFAGPKTQGLGPYRKNASLKVTAKLKQKK